MREFFYFQKLTGNLTYVLCKIATGQVHTFGFSYFIRSHMLHPHPVKLLFYRRRCKGPKHPARNSRHLGIQEQLRFWNLRCVPKEQLFRFIHSAFLLLYKIKCFARIWSIRYYTGTDARCASSLQPKKAKQGVSQKIRAYILCHKATLRVHTFGICFLYAVAFLL